MAYLPYLIRPLKSGMGAEFTGPFMQQGFSPWMENFKVDQNSLQKRWGYTAHRLLPSQVYTIALYAMNDGTRNTMYLTASDLCKRETGTNKTFSYHTDAYTTGKVTNITGAVLTGSGTSWNTAGLANGDQFILDDDLTADEEPDTNWATVSSVGGATTITLTGDYSGTTGAMNKNYRIRKVYAVPASERWAWTIVNNTFCFTNGNTDVQYWDGGVTSNYAQPVDATNAKQARYCMEYADRLFLADIFESGARMPFTIKWSGEGDPTHFDPGVDATSGEADLLETDDYITGLGKVSGSIIVYKRDSIVIGYRTGDAYSPITFNPSMKGIGLNAPYSLIEFMGTNAWVGRNDFFMLQGSQPVPIRGEGNEDIRHIFFEITGDTEVQNTWGWNNALEGELIWTANTNQGQYSFVYSYKENAWYMYNYDGPITCAGMGGL